MSDAAIISAPSNLDAAPARGSLSTQQFSGVADPTAPMSAVREAPIFAEIEKVAKPDITDAPEPKPEPVPVVDADPDPEKKEDKPATEQPAETAAEVPPEKMAPKQLRDAYDKLKAKLKELEAKPAAAPSNILEVPEFKELQAKVTAKEQEASAIAKKAEELEKTVQFLDYEQSAEFKEKYYKPYVAAWQNGKNEIAKLTVPNEDGTAGRKATFEDLSAIVAEPDMERALEMAENLFKNATKANYALGLREKIITAANVQDQAKAEFKARSVEIAQAKAAESQASQKAQVEFWNSENKAWAEKNPNFIKPAEGDTRAAELIDIGTKAADMAFGDTSHMTPQQRAKLYSETRNRAAAFGHVAHKLATAEKKNQELTAELAKYKTSAPGKGTVPAEAKKLPVSMAERIDALAR